MHPDGVLSLLLRIAESNRSHAKGKISTWARDVGSSIAKLSWQSEES